MNQIEIMKQLVDYGMPECMVEQESISIMRDVKSLPHYAALIKDKIDKAVETCIKIRVELFLHNQMLQEKRRELRYLFMRKGKSYTFEVEYV